MKVSHTPLQRVGQRIAVTNESHIEINYNLCKPKISFQFLAEEQLKNCEVREKSEVLTTLYRISQHTWQELNQLGRKSGGFELIPLMQLRCKYPNNEMFSEGSKAVVFHHATKIPLIGFHCEDIFYIFCIDRDYKAYKH